MWDEVIPSGICVRKNPVSEGWQSWKESKETGQTFRKSGVLRLSGNKLPYPLAWLPRPLADNARLSEIGKGAFWEHVRVSYTHQLCKTETLIYGTGFVRLSSRAKKPLEEGS